MINTILSLLVVASSANLQPTSSLNATARVSAIETPALAGKAGGANSRLQQKQLRRRQGSEGTCNKPALAGKAGGSKSRLQQRQIARRALA